MGKSKIIIRILITVMFLVSLYFVEAGFCGSRVVAKYNDGFGTVDMKSYDAEVVRKALAALKEKGIKTYKQYYLMDYIFVLCFGAFQIMLTMCVFSFEMNSIVKKIIVGIPILRGVCDIIENSILLKTLFTYPKINETAISVSAKFTTVKLLCIKLWIAILLLGFGFRMVKRIGR